MKENKVWFFSSIQESFAEQKEFSAGDTVDIQIMRVGKWNHPQYGQVIVTEETISDVVQNYTANQRGIDLAVDENHEGNHRALGWFKNVYQQGKDALFATIELTKLGADIMTQGAYKYFSPEIIFNKQDEETGDQIRNLLVGGAFTNRPFFKRMQPLMASEVDENSTDTMVYITKFNESMTKFLELLGNLQSVDGAFSEEQKGQVQELKGLFSSLSDEDKTAYKAMFEEVEAKDAEPSTDVEGEETTEEGTEVIVDEAKEEGIEETPATEDVPAEETKVEATEEDEVVEEEIVEVKEEPKEEVKVEASEKVETSQFSEMKNMIKNLQKELATKNRTLRFNESKEKLSTLVFSEGNKSGVVTPNLIDTVAEFSVGLSEQQATQFFSILSSLQTNLSEKTKEFGTNEDAQVASEVEQFYMEKMGLSRDEAKAAIELANKSTS